VKALDSGVLRSILEGDRAARDLLRHLRGFEVATTERALLELGIQARRAPSKVQSARRTVLDRLRRKLTVLPVDHRAVNEALRRATAKSTAEELWQLAEWGALEAGGCEELFTHSTHAPAGKWRFKVTRVGAKRTK
jgi:hypothetical protein